MRTKRCPSCGGDINIYFDHSPGDDVYCEDCEREFQLISIKPLRLESINNYDDDYHFEGDDYFEEDEYY